MSDELTFKAKIYISEVDRLKMMSKPVVQLNCKVLESHTESDGRKVVTVIDKMEVLSISIVEKEKEVGK